MRNLRLYALVLWLGMLATLSACDFDVDDATRIARAEAAAAQGDYREAVIELKNVLRSDPANVYARVLLGRVSLEGGDPSAAAKELQRARELGAGTDEYVVPLARALLNMRRPDEVLTFQSEQLDEPSARADLAAVLGNAFLQKGEVGEAESKFAGALTIKPGHADALVGMARVYLDRQDMQAAENALREVIAQHPDAHAAYSALARIQMNNVEYDDAAANFRLAIENSDSPGLRNERMNYLAGLVDALLALKDAGAARAVAAQMLEIGPEHPYALFQAARVDFESGDLDGTIEKAQRVVSSYPDYQPARFLLAAAAMSKENFSLAEMHLRSVVKASPDNAAARQLLARAQMSMGSPNQAFNALEPLLRDSADPRLLAMAGAASLRSGDTARGMDYLTRGLESGAGDPAVQMQAASSFIAAGEIDKAISLLEQMPESMHGEQRDFLLILARLRAGDVDGARSHANRVLEQNPDDPMAHRIMGGFHMAVNEYDLARAQFEMVRKLDPGDVGTIINLARLDAMDGDIAGAEKRYNDLLQQQPGSLVAMLGLSQLAEKAGNQPRAVKLLEDAARANPDAVQPPLLLARYFLRTGSTDKAMERAKQALAVAPNSAEANNMMGQVQLQTGRFSEAISSFERSLQQEPNRAETHFFLSQAQLKFNSGDAARKSLEKAIELDPKHLGSRIALSRLETVDGNFAEAIVVAEGIKADFPDRAESHVLIGDIQVLRGFYNAAIKAYDDAAMILPNDTVTLKRFESRRRAGQLGAYKILEEWLSAHPENPAVRVTLAQAYQQKGDTDKAVAEYLRVLDTEPDNVVAQNNLAWVYSELGGADNLRKGIEIAEKAHRNLPGVGQVTDTYGWLLLKQGKVDLATQKLRQAMSQAPDDPDIRYHLAVALQRSGGSAEARDLLDAILSDGSSFSSRDEAKRLRESL